MLQLYLGRAGAGKTTAIEESIQSALTSSAPKIYLVPEQYSFQTEKRMLLKLGAQESRQMQVLSFRRLVDVIYNLYGKPAGTVVTEGTRQLFMSLALEQTEAELTFFAGKEHREPLIAMLLQLEKELKQCQIPLSVLTEMQKTTEENTLRQKLKEITLLLSAYEAMLSRSHLDPLDDLERILPMVKEHGYFNHMEIWVDGFLSFTAQEQSLLGCMLAQAEQVNISLCTDTIAPTPDAMLFAPPCTTAQKLIALAREQGCKVAKPYILHIHKWENAPDLSFLEQHFFREDGAAFAETPANITVFCGKTRHEEAEYVASEVRRMVMEEGMRYREIAILVRNLSAYRSILDVALQQADIAYFLDDPDTIFAEPLLQATLSALSLAQQMDTETMFTYLKTGIPGFSVEEIAELENYTYLWRINGKAWLTPWTQHPDGYGREQTDTSKRTLQHFNHLRERVVSPLYSLREATKEGNGTTYATAVYQFLETIFAKRQISAHVEQLQQMGQFTKAETQLRVWDTLMLALEELVSVLQEQPLSRERFTSLLTLVLTSHKLAEIPEGLDQVAVGVADHTRLDQVKVVFVLGAVEGEFPAVMGEGGLLTSSERITLHNGGIELSGTMDTREAEERFLCYRAITQPSQHLYVTWFAQEVAGEKTTPSSILTALFQCFPKLTPITEQSQGAKPHGLTAKTAFARYAKERRSGSVLAGSLEQVIQSLPTLTPQLQALSRVERGQYRGQMTKATAKEFYGDTLRISASQLENFSRCGFQYLCTYGLRLKERKRAEITALEFGNVMHYLLETFFQELGHQGILSMPQDALREKIRLAVYGYANQFYGEIELQTAKFLHQLEGIVQSAEMILLHVAKELQQSKFQPIGFEMELKEDGDFPPLVIETEEGSVQVEGKLDRVDVFTEGDVQYVRIIDYKTGAKQFKLQEVLWGLQLQMLLYLAAITESQNYASAGVLYMPATRPVVTTQRDDTPETQTQAVAKKLCMSGLLLKDTAVLQAMEPAGKKQFAPFTMQGDTVRNSESLLSQQEFSAVLHYCKEKIAEMATTLFQGNHEIAPLKGQHNSCEYCPYFPVCCHEERDGGRIMGKVTAAKALEQIEQEVTANDSLD